MQPITPPAVTRGIIGVGVAEEGGEGGGGLLGQLKSSCNIPLLGHKICVTSSDWVTDASKQAPVCMRIVIMTHASWDQVLARCVQQQSAVPRLVCSGTCVCSVPTSA